jgi:magnesium chelatase family protein
VDRYQARISGPLLDRIDIVVRLDAEPLAAVQARRATGECSAAVRERVRAARARQLERWGPGGTNARVPWRQLADGLDMGRATQREAAELGARAALTHRGFARVLRVARTIADLAGSEKVTVRHVLEATDLRMPIDGSTTVMKGAEQHGK